MKKNRVLLFCAFSFALLSSVHAMPSGEALIHGDCTFAREGSSLTITQQAGRAIINWESFSLAQGELVQFVQPDSRSALLNRVISQSPSEIYGQLQANGKIYLINQNGIVVGPTGKIQAASFIASTLHLEDELFLQDELRFSSNKGGKLLQQGMIAVEGNIFLLAREVVNEGLLSAPNGSVCLAAGSEVYLIDSRDGGTVKISGVGSVSNTGEIEAARAELRAAAGNIYALAVNQEGVTNATGSMEVDGEIILQAESGLVAVSGKMSAEHGGKIHLLGDFVHLTNDAALSVSGDAGGGEILVGGDYKGSNPAIPNAKGIYVGPGVHISADALQNGDGGKIIFWGNDANCYYGMTSAQGGPLGGDGGFVEISSHGLLVPEGHVTTFAPKGKTGTLLFDPVLVNISSGSNSGVNGLPPPPMPTEPDPYTVVFNASSANINTTNLQNALGVNNIIINSTGTGTGDGEIVITSSLTWGTATTLTLIAASITVDAAVTVSNTFSGSNFTAFDFQANLSSSFSISFSGIHLRGTISTVDGNISLQGNCPGTGPGFGGVFIDGGTASATGLGSITIIGNAGASQEGTTIASDMGSALVSVVNGNMSITGTAQTGINIAGATISSTGMGSITIAGTGNQTSQSVGIGVTSLSLSTVSSNITLTGIGSPTSTAAFNAGVILEAVISSTSGTITINGTGGGTTGSSGDNFGITMSATSLSCANGSISLTGIGGSVGTLNSGIDSTALGQPSIIGSSGSASIALNGTAGTTSGVGIDASQFSITGTSGPISLTGVGVGGSAGLILATIGGSTSGPITLQANSMTFNGNVTTTGAILVEPVTTTLSIGLGNGAGALSLSNTALAHIQPGTTATIGRANGTHTITINNAVFASNFTMQGSVITIGAIGITNANSKTITFDVGIHANGSFTQNGPLTSGSFFANGAVFNDTFTITDSSQTLTINGGAGSNELIGPTAGSSWTVTGNNAGTLGNDTFSNIGFLQGGTGVDTFTFMGAFQLANVVGSTGINGTSGNDTIVGPGATTTWAITSSNTGTLTPGAAGATAFTNIVNLTGGSLNDSFVFSDGAGITGAINGGAGTNTLDYSLYSTAVSVNIATGIATNITGGFTNLQNFMGGMATDTLTGPNTANTWAITGNNAGNINSSAFTFSSFENLVGGTMNDSFAFSNGTSVSGTLNGGTGTNTLDYSLYLTAVSVNIGAGTATGTAGISNFQNFIGGSASSNTLTGPVANNVWDITTNNAGNINSSAFTFSAFENLTGSTGTDSFVFTMGVTVGGTIDGGTGENTLNYNAYTTPVSVNIATGTATATGGFANIQIFIGGSGNNTFTGPNGNTLWEITGTNAGLVNGGQYTFSAFANLIGGLLADHFTFDNGQGVTGTINGGAGANIFDYSAYVAAVSVNIGAGTATGTGGFSNIQSFIGGMASTDTLVGPNSTNTWSITTNNAGNINSSAFTFSAFENLTGGSMNDSFAFSNGVTIQGTLDGGSGVNTLDYTAYVAEVDVNIGAGTATGTGGIANIQDFIGGMALTNTLTGPNSANTWSITGSNTGNINSSAFTFSAFENLTGGTMNDSFAFSSGASVTGAINGGAGTNTLDYSAYSAVVSVNIAAGTAPGIGGGFSNIQNFIGSSSSNTLTGPNTTNAWAITGTNSGNINSSAFTFSAFENLTGGTMNDTFAFSSGASIAGVINGGAGTNSLDYSAYAMPVSVNIAADTATGIGGTFANIENFVGSGSSSTLTGPNTTNTWTITSSNAGNINSSAITFSGFGSLIGNSMSDDFVFMNGAGVTGAINGGAGTNTFDYSAYVAAVSVNIGAGTSTGTGSFSNIQDFIGGMAVTNTLTGPNSVNTWDITGTNAGNINSGAFTFSSFENLTGGTMNDTFVFGSGTSISGLLDGGAGTNTLDYSGYVAAVSVNIGAGTAPGPSSFTNIQNFIGSSSSSNLLTGPNSANTWAITGSNTGNINSSAFTFSSFENLTGGTMNDSFAFSSGASVTGAINGGAGTNTLNYSAYSAAVSVNIGAGTAPGIGGGFSNIQNFVGSSSSSNFLIGPDSANTWAITGTNSGNINSSAFTFSAFENLTGGSMNDTFAFSNGASVGGVIDGGPGTNSLNYSSYALPVSVSIEAGTATGTGGFANIQNFIGNGSNSTLTGPNTINTWTITGSNTGNINSSAFTFSAFGSLIGGTMNDSFVFMNGAGVTGAINGGAGANSFDYSAYASPVSVNIASGTATGTGGFSNIESFIGSSGSTLTGPNSANTWDIVGSDAGNINMSAFTFSGFGNLIGGTLNDSFVFTGGVSVSGSIDGGTGINTLDYHLYTTPVSVNIGAGTATGTAGIANIQNFIGGSASSNTLAGPNTTNTWSITATDAGNINASAFTFSAFENLTGGPFNDTFDFTSGFTVSGTVNGSTGSNTLLAPNSPNTWEIISNDTGTVAGITFLSIQNLTGNAMTDDFIFQAGGGVQGNVTGGGGVNTFDYSSYGASVFVIIGEGLATGVGSFSNIQNFIGSSGMTTLQGPNTINIWQITGTNAGNINSGAFTFTSFENLTGGTDDDTFDFTAGFLISGTINGNGGSNTLLAPDSNNTWTITSTGDGNVAGITFSSLQNLTGGTLTDDFIFADGAGVSGAIDGGGGINTFNYSAYTSPVFANIGAGTTTGAGSFSNIQNFIGGESDSDTLTGPNTANTWNFTAQDQGDINAGAFTFTSFENLTGGSSSDEFIFNSALALNVSGVLNGGGGVNTLDYSTFSSSVVVNIEAGTATSTGGIANLQDFIGGTGVNTLTGPASTSWVITGLNSGTINGIYSFTSFANLIGGSGNDTFDFTPGFLITGTLDGGPGSNTLLAPNTNNIWHITGENAGNVSGITFINIQNLVGGSLNDQFIFADQQGVSGSINGGGPSAGNVLDYSLFTTAAMIVFTSPTSGMASNLGGGFTDIGSIVGNHTSMKVTDLVPIVSVYSTQLSLSYLLATPLWYDLFNKLQLELNEVLSNTNRLWMQVHASVINKTGK